MYPIIYIFGKPIGTYGLLMVLGFLTAGYLAARKSRKHGLVPEDVIVVGAVAFGFAMLFGGLLFVFVTYPLDYILEQVRHGNFDIFFSGIVFYGALIGGIAGAAPPALGWVAVTGTLDPHALLLVLIIFVWTPPHFWALAIFRREDYARALIPMLPVTHGVTYTRWQILFYTVLLVVVTVLPWATGMSGLFYLGGALVLGAVFLWYAWKLLDPPDDFFAMRTFNYSVVYLMALFAFLLVDHWLQPWLAPMALMEFERIGGGGGCCETRFAARCATLR